MKAQANTIPKILQKRNVRGSPEVDIHPLKSYIEPEIYNAPHTRSQENS